MANETFKDIEKLETDLWETADNRLIPDDYLVFLPRQIAITGCNYDALTEFLVCAAACCTNSLFTAGKRYMQTAGGRGDPVWMKREMILG